MNHLFHHITMLTKSVLVAAVAWGLSSATPLLSPHVIHEKRHVAPIGWSRKDALEPQAVLPVSIALAQENLHRGDDWLMDVSHPDSPNYGKHWSAEEVVSAYAPRYVLPRSRTGLWLMWVLAMRLSTLSRAG